MKAQEGSGGAGELAKALRTAAKRMMASYGTAADFDFRRVPG